MDPLIWPFEDYIKKDQRKKNSKELWQSWQYKETKKDMKVAVWVYQTTNWRDLTQEELDLEIPPKKRTIPSKDKPIRFLLMMLKILTAQTREKIYNSLIYGEQLPG